MSFHANKIYLFDNPSNENEVVNKKYVEKNFLKNKINIDDISNEILSGTNFSFRDMANDILDLINLIYENPEIKNYINNFNINNFNINNLENTINNTNLILRNICRNFVNDPSGICFDPDCFYKRVQLLTPSGQPFVDVATYKSDGKGRSRGLHLDRDIIYLEIKENILNNEIQGSNSVKFNPSNLNTDNLSTLGVIRKRRVVAFTEPSLDSNQRYKILPTTNIGNPIQKTPIRYEIAQNLSATQEVIDSIKNGWGWISKTSGSNTNYLPGYFIAHNVDLPINDEYNIVVRLSYQIY